MHDDLVSLGIFKIPSSSTWDSIRAGLLARVDALEICHLIELGFTVDMREVAWVTIYRSADDVITASGPHGPYEATGRETWRWEAADDSDQPARSTLIAHTVVEFLKSLDAVPEGKEPNRFNGAVHFRMAAPTSAFVNRELQWGAYAEHRTGAQLDKLLHFGHAIPVGKGYTERHVNENFPGWSWGGLIEVLKAAGVFVGRGGSPPRSLPTVKAIHFTDAKTWAVEWLSGEITRSAEPRRGSL